LVAAAVGLLVLNARLLEGAVLTNWHRSPAHQSCLAELAAATSEERAGASDSGRDAGSSSSTVPQEKNASDSTVVEAEQLVWDEPHQHLDVEERRAEVESSPTACEAAASPGLVTRLAEAEIGRHDDEVQVSSRHRQASPTDEVNHWTPARAATWSADHEVEASPDLGVKVGPEQPATPLTAFADSATRSAPTSAIPTGEPRAATTTRVRNPTNKRQRARSARTSSPLMTLVGFAMLVFQELVLTRYPGWRCSPSAPICPAGLELPPLCARPIGDQRCEVRFRKLLACGDCRFRGQCTSSMSPIFCKEIAIVVHDDSQVNGGNENLTRREARKAEKAEAQGCKAVPTTEASPTEASPTEAPLTEAPPPPPSPSPEPQPSEPRSPELRSPVLRSPVLRSPVLRSPVLRSPVLRSPVLRSPEHQRQKRPAKLRSSNFILAQPSSAQPGPYRVEAPKLIPTVLRNKTKEILGSCRVTVMCVRKRTGRPISPPWIAETSAARQHRRLTYSQMRAKRHLAPGMHIHLNVRYPRGCKAAVQRALDPKSLHVMSCSADEQKARS
jgi:hypothetical protein